MSETGCIFCGRSPQTKTHVFRKAWISRLTVPAGDAPYEMIHGTADLTGAARETQWESDEFGMAPGAACDACNSGWMDDVDRAAEQIVEPMVIGHRATIRGFQKQKAVARWVSQVAILIDQTQIQQTVPAELTHAFYETREPLAGMRIWLAASADDWSVEAWQRSWILAPAADPVTPNRPNMSLFTFRIVNLVVQALVPLDAAAATGYGVTRGENMKFLRQAWPSTYTPVSWPPAVWISRDTLPKFAQSFERDGAEPGDVWIA